MKPTPTDPAIWHAPCRHLVYEVRPRRDTPTGSTSQVTEDVCRNCGAVLRTIINGPGRANEFAVRAHQDHWTRHYRQRYMEGASS